MELTLTHMKSPWKLLENVPQKSLKSPWKRYVMICGNHVYTHGTYITEIYVHSVTMINIQQVIVLLCSICDLDTRVNLKNNQNILLSRSSIKSLRRQTQFFFHINRRFWNLHLLLQNAPECTILRQLSKNSPGETPRTPTCGKGWRHPIPPPSPFRRFAPQWSLRLQILVLQQFSIKKVGHPCCSKLPLFHNKYLKIFINVTKVLHHGDVQWKSIQSWQSLRRAKLEAKGWQNLLSRSMQPTTLMFCLQRSIATLSVPFAIDFVWGQIKKYLCFRFPDRP